MANTDPEPTWDPDRGPETSEPPTAWPDDVAHHGPEHVAEEDDHHAVPPELLELYELHELAGNAGPYTEETA